MSKYNYIAPQVVEAELTSFTTNDGTNVEGYNVRISEETMFTFPVDVFNKLFEKAMPLRLTFGEALDKLKENCGIARMDSGLSGYEIVPEFIVFMKPDGTLGKITDNQVAKDNWIPTVEEMFATDWFVMYENIIFKTEKQDDNSQPEQLVEGHPVDQDQAI